MTLNGVEYDLIEWAEIGKEGEGHPACHGNRDLDDEQLGIIKEACAVPLAEASITEHEAVATIAEVLRTH